jgi:DNA-binding CsgD family transcriptional regulator
MKKENPKMRWHLTDAEIEQIRTRALEGMNNTDIAAQMHITRNTVALAKRKLGLPVWPALPEAEVLRLLKTGMAPRAVAQKLGASYRGVTKFANANGFGRPRRKLSAAQKAKIDRMILRHEKSAQMIAKTCSASYKFVLRRAHVLLDCLKFLPVHKDPLRSYFPLGNHPPNGAGLST